MRLSRARSSAGARTRHPSRATGAPSRGPPVNLHGICITGFRICQHYRRCGPSDRGPPDHLCGICTISLRICQPYQRCGASDRGLPVNLHEICITSSWICQYYQRCAASPLLNACQMRGGTCTFPPWPIDGPLCPSKLSAMATKCGADASKVTCFTVRIGVPSRCRGYAPPSGTYSSVDN